MAAPRPLAPSGAIFLDDRGGGRALRVTWHSEADVVVLSLWRENVCAGSFRVQSADVPSLLAALAAGLAPAKAG
jgi:hypothetical protein